MHRAPPFPWQGYGTIRHKLLSLSSGQFEEDIQVFLRETFGEMFVVERGSFNHILSQGKRKFRRNTSVENGALAWHGIAGFCQLITPLRLSDQWQSTCPVFWRSVIDKLCLD